MDKVKNKLEQIAEFKCDAKQIAERIKLIAEEKSTEIKSLARTIHINSNIITKAENGIMPAIDDINKIAMYFNVSLDYLFGRTDIKSVATTNKDSVAHAVKVIAKYQGNSLDYVYERLRLSSEEDFGG